jgi:hypothetical protein
MKTKETKNLLVIGVVLIVSLIVIGSSGSIQGGEKIYEIKPEITLPESRTDAARAIDAYEHVMDRFMNLTERNFMGIDTDVKDIAKKVSSIDYKLTELSARMARIEKALGIEQPKGPVEKTAEAKTPIDNIDNPSLEDKK